jgi:hypothetical protein
LELKLCIFLDATGLGGIFMVAASRMGNMMKPRWCFSDVPFDMNLTAVNDMSANDSTSKFVVTMRFVTDFTLIYPSYNYMDAISCESL